MGSLLVIGGTTFFGKVIVERALERGYEVTVFSRGHSRPGFLDHVEHVQGDRSEPGELAEKLKDRSFDAVIDNIAYSAEDVNDARSALEGRTGRYALTSSAAVYYTAGMGMPVDEDQVNFDFKPPRDEANTPFWRYTTGKLAAERALMEQDRLPYTILRPPVVLGPEDPTLRGHFYFQRLLDEGPLILTNGGVQSFRLVYAGDLADGYLNALEREAARGRTYNLAQHEIVRLVDFVRLAARALGVSPQWVNVPESVLQENEWDYPEPYARMTNFVPSVARAKAELDWTTTPFERWVSDTARWYRDVYEGKDSSGYAQREREIAFAERFRRVVSA